MNPLESGSVDINGFPIHYEKYGSGSHIVLLIPGALGTAQSDFVKQLSGPVAFDLKRYTFVAVDLPGWGQSRPPKRPYGIDVYDNDVVCVTKLMESLNYRNYSIIGWSDGAKVAILAAILQPSRVQSVVASGIFVYCTRYNILPTMKTQKVDLWASDLRENYQKIYGDELQKLWDDHINFCKDLQSKIVSFADSRPDIKEIRFAIHEKLMHGLNQIRCPVLLIHGDKDPLISADQPLYCQERIANCQMKRFPDASHNVHQTHTEEFRDLVDQFFEDSWDFF